MKTDWTDDIRNRLADYRRVAPDFSAEDFDRMMSSAEARREELRQAQASALQRSAARNSAGRHRRVAWMLIPAAAALVVLVGLILSLNHNPAGNVDASAAMAYLQPRSLEATPEQTFPDVTGRQSSVDAVSPPFEAMSRSRQQPVQSSVESTLRQMPSEAVAPSAVFGQTSESEQSELLSSAFSEYSEQSNASEALSGTSMSSASGGNISLEDAFPAEEIGAKRVKKPRFGRISSKIYIGGGGSAGNTMSPGLAAAQVYGDNVHEACKMNAAYESFSTTAVDVHHRPPLRGGVSLHYAIGGRWGIESGVLFSYHESEITTTIGSSSYSDMQRLAFVGIPLNVVYEFARDNDFRLYLTAGGMAEKMLWSEEGQTMRPLQYSLNGGIGLAYRLYGGLAFFAEPGVRYSFDNGAGFRTLYADHPFGFDFRLGVRINL